MVIIKWSKTMQNRAKVATISLPYLGFSPLCPVKALVTMLAASGQDPDRPLFQVCKPAALVCSDGLCGQETLGHHLTHVVTT